MKIEIENEWLDSEIASLTIETKQKKKKKRLDNLTTFKFFLMLTAVFFYAPVVEAKPIKAIMLKKHTKIMGEGRNFICPKCRTCQWQHEKNADWAGNFYCSVCGHNLGK